MRYDARMFKDEAPRVIIAQPKTDRDVPTDAIVPLRIELDDDFGLHSARLMYKVATGESEPHDAEAIPLWSAPTTENAPGQPSFVKQQEIAYEWNLAPLKLPVGSIITFYADARDFDSIKGPNLGKSREIRLRIVSKEDAARQFDDARRELREEIARILAMQKQAITPVDEAARTLSKTDRLPRAQRDELNNSALIQRQVGSRMNNRDEGLEQRIRQLLADLANFKISSADAQQQLQDMLQRLGRVRDQNLGPAEQGADPSGQEPGANSRAANRARPGRRRTGRRTAPRESTSQGGRGQTGRRPGQERRPIRARRMTRLRPARSQAPGGEPKNSSGQTPKSAGQSPAGQGAQQPEKEKPEQAGSPLDNAKQALAEAKTNQQAIADELQKMLDSLGEFETYRGVVKDAQNLLKKHEETMKQSGLAATKPDLMSKPAEALAPEQKAELANLAGRQSEVAKGLQNLLERMDELSKQLEESDPLAAAAMREAAAESRKQGTGAKMGEAADHLEKNQMGQARSRQETARQELRNLVDAVAEPAREGAGPAGQGAQEGRIGDARAAQAAGGEPQGDPGGQEEPKRPGASQSAQETGQGASPDSAGAEAAVAAAGQA